MKDLKEKAIRGGLARLFAQGANFGLRLASLMVLARLLVPRDFGLVGMVTAFTGVLGVFRDFGLSSAAIQRAHVTEDQLSTLFWINLAVGAVLGLIAAAMAPAVAAFYHEPRLVRVTLVLAATFLFNAAGVQHGALLQREMRFTAIAVINTIGLVVGTAIAIVGAKFGYGYWALVAMTVTLPLTGTLGAWLATGWIPGPPRRNTGMRSMMKFGGTMTTTWLVMYIASNFEKVLLGRCWGGDALGLYGRSYQLVNIPTDNLNSAAGEVAFSGLSRVQDDPPRLRSYFLKGYSLVLALTLPITAVCAVFADDIIRVVLGAKWMAAAPILRFLSPTILVFAIVNPLGWLMGAIGLVKRNLKIGLVVAPVMILGYIVGLPYGPKGVACAYSTVMLLWALPVIAWAVHGTAISFRDVLVASSHPLAASIAAAGLAYGVRAVYGQYLPPLPRLVLESTIVLVAFFGLLLFVAGQKAFYLELVKGLINRAPVEEKVLTPV
jgi:O-antigen/teichoic acid export membrane protein